MCVSRSRLRSTLLALLAAGGALAVAPAASGWPADVALSTAPGDQGITWSRTPGLSIAADGQGGAILAWEDRAGMSLRLQRLSREGVALWTQGGVAPAPTGCRQSSPRLVADGAGGVIVMWLEGRLAPCAGFLGGSTLYAQRVDALGQALWPAGGIVVAGSGSNAASSIALASDAAGGAYVVWVGGGGPTPGQWFRAQRVDGAGNLLWAAGGVLVGGLNNGDPHIVADGAGGLLVAWNRMPDDPHGPFHLALQRLDAQGAGIWAPGGVIAGTASRRIGLVADGAGGAIVSFGHSNPFFSARAQRVGANGTPLWTEGGVALASDPEGDPPDQLDPDLVGDGAGGAIVAWTDEREYGMGQDIYAQRVGPDGSLLWPQTGVAIARAPGNQDLVRLVSDGAGGALIAWLHLDEMNLFAQRIDASGDTLWSPDGIPVSTAPGNQGVSYGSDVTPGYALEVVASGEAIAVWPDGRNGPCQPSSIANCDVYAQQVLAGVQVPALPVAARAALAALLAVCAYRSRAFAQRRADC